MARETSTPMPPPPALIKSSQPKRAATRRRPTALRTSLLAQIGTRKGLGSDQLDLTKQTRRLSSTSNKPSSATIAAQEIATREKRNRADDANNEVPTLDSSLLSDTSVLRYDNDPCITPPYKLLAYENRSLARRIDSLESENAGLAHTRQIERDRLSEINASLVDKIHAHRQEAACWAAQAEMWKGMAMDRDGEVQRLRMQLQELVGPDGRID